MKVKLKIYFEAVIKEIEIPDGLDEDEQYQAKCDKIFDENMIDDLKEQTDIDYWEEK